MKPMFFIKKYPSKTYPYQFVRNKPTFYQVVYANIEDGKRAIEARFGACNFRMSKELIDEQRRLESGAHVRKPVVSHTD